MKTKLFQSGNANGPYYMQQPKHHHIYHEAEPEKEEVKEESEEEGTLEIFILREKFSGSLIFVFPSP